MDYFTLKNVTPWLSVLFDLAIVWYLVYRGLLLFKGTRAMPMLIGLACIGVVYFVAQPLGLVTVAWILDNFLSSIILVIVVIFQDEIRRTLTKVGAHPLLFAGGRSESPSEYEEIATAVGKLAKARLGSIIVIEGDVGLDEFLDEGVSLDAKLSRKLLYGIFVKESPMHDGAVVIKGPIVRAAGVVLPLSSNPDIDPGFGTRHRAALGITERSDALVIVVSEESGSITVFVDGKQFRNLEASALPAHIQSHARKDSKNIRGASRGVHNELQA
ncbi:MAG: diadenylate cyclase CdaA [Pseudomonadota bacterium]|jgi:diadenylate cyclase